MTIESWASVTLNTVQEARPSCCRTNALEGDDSPLIPETVHVWHLIEGRVCLCSCQSSTVLASRAPTATIGLEVWRQGLAQVCRSRVWLGHWCSPCSPAFCCSFALTVEGLIYIRRQSLMNAARDLGHHPHSWARLFLLLFFSFIFGPPSSPSLGSPVYLIFYIALIGRLCLTRLSHCLPHTEFPQLTGQQAHT
ncbi:uncharacterized protein BJX67DRAFT_39882 [Aspergillus lucknowensis]|uniref:Uncharacterized protein n=1 Tax=Aspergillus lucknowensis TaxID=176173 RepID=A0ABR4LWI5_9EURO